ncbi:hypothetical protein D6R50_10760 [Aeromonas veronii]|uniref:Uncharacterized protein n=1 Tax=Aeromonas veronii TaxID=654 RepID=A0A3A9IMP8_AERVE|nr:hypothetical protein D6R50_23070 [Aeromonas veronii]RKJ89713.1 hypothetical protein D6R50_10760 [Aeromonas veronii]
MGVNPDAECHGTQTAAYVEQDYRMPQQVLPIRNFGFGRKPGPVTLRTAVETLIRRPGENVRPALSYIEYPAEFVRIAPALTVAPATVQCAEERAGAKTTCPMALTWSAETALEVTAQTAELSDKCYVQVLGTRIGAAPTVLNNLVRENGSMLTQDLETTMTCSEPGSYNGRLLFRAVYK